ncbi:MAG TPA: methylmalonyl-CoA mutase family protein [Cyclobacteriaceae bacterium]|nr:methylmalonyl-CoA mutase family protein [Cyclobacteriaceae bacterium]
MVKPTQQDNSEIQFRTPGVQEWAEAAQQELGSANLLGKLQVFKGELVIEPYYKKHDKNQPGFSLPVSDSKIYGPRTWQNMPAIKIINEKKANTRALHYLNTGADGILFVIDRSEIDYEALLTNIGITHCAVSFLIEKGYEPEAERFLKSTYKQTLTGCIFYRLPPIFKQNLLGTSTTFQTCGICITPTENPVDELVQALENGVTILDVFTNKGLTPDAIASQIAFHIQVDADFFLSIAKLKTLKKLWNTVLEAYAVVGTDTPIHAVSIAWSKETFQPHGNLIKSTTTALAAIAGGCRYLSVQPENDEEPGNRACRLVSEELREESHLSKVADPTAGSYYLDSLIQQLSEKAWHKFQTRVQE